MMWHLLQRATERRLSTSDTKYVDMIKAQTPESIAAFAREFLGAANKVEVVMTPEPQ